MAKNDRISIMTKGGSPLAIQADKGGRTVEGDWELHKDRSSWYVAKLLTRGGTVLEELQVPGGEVVSITKVIKETP